MTPQVRSIQRLSQHGLAQRLPIAGMSLVSVLPALSPSSAQGEPGAAQTQSAGGSMLLGSPAHGEVQQLVAVPFAEQARVLAQVEEFAEGLALAALVPLDEVGCAVTWEHSQPGRLVYAWNRGGLSCRQ